MKYTCPISFKEVDENVVRIVSLFTLILVILSFFFTQYSTIIFIFLIADFSARIWKPELSLLKHLSVLIAHDLLKLKPKPTGAAPKRFAAGVGLVFSIILLLIPFLYTNCSEANCLASTNMIPWVLKNIFISFFVIAISLETFFGYCLGCKTYSLLQTIKGKLKK